MTYPDRTVYPVASPNLADFNNLVSVYLDAVFAPRLDRWAFQQEGWTLELTDAADNSATPPTKPTLAYRGVVYNEMKGVYSSADAVHSAAIDAALWPSNVYSRSSGGDPLAIPSLTYEAYRSFHDKWYTPANARVFFFGDDNPARRLELVHEYAARRPST